MKKILLVLSPWFPYPADNGSRMRIFNLLRQLSREFQLRVVVGVQDDSPAETPTELSGLCSEIVRVPWLWHDGASGGLRSTIRALLSPTPRSIIETTNPPLRAAIAEQFARRPDAILVCQMGMDAYLPGLTPSIPIIMDEAEITGMGRAPRSAGGPANRLRSQLMYAKATRYWREALRRYSVVTAASAVEADALRQLVGPNGPKVIVVPNGVDHEGYLRRDLAQAQPGRLIYNGSVTYGPNRDAVDFFVRDILPRIVEQVPNANLVVTGRYTNESASEFIKNPRVELTGYLADLRAALTSSAVCIVPLLSGGGTRLKILEAWGAGVPVVSTSIGASGLAGSVPGEHLLIADRPDAFAAAVVSLLRTPSIGERIAQNALRLSESRYTWSAVAAPLITALTNATKYPTPHTET